MTEPTRTQRLRQALAWLEAKGLDNIEGLKAKCDWTHGNVTIGASPPDLTSEELRQLKALFGPLKVHGSGDWKWLSGERKLDEHTTIEFHLNGAFVCEKLKPEDLTEERWDTLRQQILAGEIDVPDCKPAPTKDQRA